MKVHAEHQIVFNIISATILFLPDICPNKLNLCSVFKLLHIIIIFQYSYPWLSHKNEKQTIYKLEEISFCLTWIRKLYLLNNSIINTWVVQLYWLANHGLILPSRFELIFVVIKYVELPSVIKSKVLRDNYIKTNVLPLIVSSSLTTNIR